VEDAAQQCRADGAQAQGFVVDVTDRAQVDAMVQAVLAAWAASTCSSTTPASRATRSCRR
jgi:NAD(P)-dependent dehydrogenase (short-subunit alcohol dehydrogenase family)